MKDEREKKDLNERLKRFALRVIDLGSELPKTRIAHIIEGQLLRSGTSPGANYREACRARSNPEFVSKISIVIQELDETLYWLEILSETKILAFQKILPLHSESNELISIFTSISKKTKARLKG